MAMVLARSRQVSTTTSVAALRVLVGACRRVGRSGASSGGVGSGDRRRVLSGWQPPPQGVRVANRCRAGVQSNCRPVLDGGRVGAQRVCVDYTPHPYSVGDGSQSRPPCVGVGGPRRRICAGGVPAAFARAAAVSERASLASTPAARGTAATAAAAASAASTAWASAAASARAPSAAAAASSSMAWRRASSATVNALSARTSARRPSAAAKAASAHAITHAAILPLISPTPPPRRITNAAAATTAAGAAYVAAAACGAAAACTTDTAYAAAATAAISLPQRAVLVADCRQALVGPSTRPPAGCHYRLTGRRHHRRHRYRLRRLRMPH